jgi:hypothetical protein
MEYYLFILRYVVVFIVAASVLIIVVIVIISTIITNERYNAYSGLAVTSHWLFRSEQELTTCTGEWEKLLDAREIKTLFYEKCRCHVNDPQKYGKLYIQILNNLVLHAWGNTMKVVYFRKFIANGSDPQKHGEFLCAFS